MQRYNLKIVFEDAGEFHPEILDTPEKAYHYMQGAFDECPMQEAFYVIALNRKNRPLGRYRATIGTATASLVHPREVFQPLVLAGASAFIASHNHPSGDPTPSRADIAITKRLAEAARVMDINLLDHVIIGDRKADPLHCGYYSFSDHGLCPQLEPYQKEHYAHPS